MTCNVFHSIVVVPISSYSNDKKLCWLLNCSEESRPGQVMLSEISFGKWTVWIKE